MKDIYTKIQLLSNKKKNELLAIVIIFMIFEAMCIFPLKYELSVSNAVMAYAYFMIGLLLCATIKRKPIIVLLIIITTNMTGFGLRIWLEWGESTMTTDLKLANVLLTYSPIIVVIIIGYLFTSYYTLIEIIMQCQFNESD
jgi:hypothetical protein